MKKTLMFIMVAMMAMTFVFAAAGSGSTEADACVKGVDDSSATCELTLKVSDTDVSGYRVGFTGSDIVWTDDVINLDTDIPETGLQTVALAYSSEDSTASTSDLYVYYKIKSNATISLTISGTGLYSDTSKKYINYDINGSDNFTTDGSSKTLWTLSPSLTEGFINDTTQLTIKTKPYNATYIADDYTTTLTLNISAS